MKQITNPLTVITKLKTARPPRDTHGVTFALYAPGDATLYRVALVTMWPAEPESQLPAQTVLLVAVNGEMIAISKPGGATAQWVAENFAVKFGRHRLGWWPAVRPLLASLRWTPEAERSTTFEPTDWSQIVDYA
jgi:hypothetical protein